MGARGLFAGLAIAARAVQVNGGTIAAENGPDGGLLIRILLPQYRDAGIRDN